MLDAPWPLGSLNFESSSIGIIARNFRLPFFINLESLIGLRNSQVQISCCRVGRARIADVRRDSRCCLSCLLKESHRLFRCAFLHLRKNSDVVGIKFLHTEMGLRHHLS